MSKIMSILQKICSILVMLVSIVFVIIEGRLVFSGDWILYESQVWGLIQYGSRFVLAILSFGIGLLPWIRIKNALYGAIALFGMSMVLLIFATNYIGEVCCIISSIYLIVSFLLVIVQQKNKKITKKV